MTTIRTTSILISAALLPLACVTTNVNQPPSVVERSPGYRANQENVVHARSTPEEDAYFADAARRDPGMQGVSRETGEEASNCRPENQAPGYVPGKEEGSVATDQRPEQKPQPKPEETATQTIVPVAVTADLTDYSESGTASWYGRDFDGRPTASGEAFDSRRLTAAHRSLPLGTVILVKNTANNKEVILKVNDRGPYVKGRVLDVSEYASEVLAFKEHGLARVNIRVVKKGEMTEKGEGATALFFRRPESGAGGAELEQKGNERPGPTDAQMEQMKKELKTDDDLKHFSVQIGLFNDLENAMRLRTYLGDRYGQPVSVYARGKDFVVKIGSYDSRFPAEQLKSRLEGDGYSGFITGPRR